MTYLNEMQCEVCRSGAPAVAEEEREVLLAQLPDWRIAAYEGIDCLERQFIFKNFALALAFTCRVGALAEAEGHHPAIITEWGKVTVRWWTHKIKGLHKNDFICASKTDALQE